MTQEAIIKCLQNGPLTSYEMENLTGIPRTSIVAACKKMFRKKELTTEKIKNGRSWITKYTLEDRMIEAKNAIPDKPWNKLNPFDIRNAKGIFTKSEYAVMNAQARSFYRGNPNFTKEITNNQYI
jgi:hypothetical protein